MARRRKTFRLILLFMFLFTAGIITVIFTVRIPCTRAAMLVINEKSGGFPHYINLKIEKISLDLKGTLHLYGIRMGKPQITRINYMTIDYSFTKFFQGILDISSMSIDSLFLTPSELLPFIENLEKTGALESEPLAALNFGGAVVNINATTVRDIKTGRPAQVEDVSLELTSGREGSFYWYINTDDVIKDGLPQINHTRMEGTYTPDMISVERMNISTISGDFLGNFVYSIPNRQAEGKVSFKKFNLNKLTQSGFFGKGKISGKVSGVMELNGNLKNLQALKSLANLKGTHVSASGLPFQSDKAVSKFMPALKELDFKTFSIAQISIDEDRIHIEGLEGTGDPLSVTGKGYIKFDGNLYFNLHCVLTEDYYQSLQPIVRDGIRKDEEGRRVFRCEIVGDLQNQKIKLDKVISQVVKSNIKKIGRGIKNLFK